MADPGGGAAGDSDTYRRFRSLVEAADHKFARARASDARAHSRRRLFEAYAEAWRFQLERRAELVKAGLKRWEIGDVASRIGQVYFAQYQLTSDLRFLGEALVFYDAVLSRGYFQPISDPVPGRIQPLSDLGVRFKALRFYARFVLVAALLDRRELVAALLARWTALLDQSRLVFPEGNFKEWRQLLQDVSRFLKAVAGPVGSPRSLRYVPQIDFHPNSSAHLARIQTGRCLRLQEAILSSHHRNEFSELTLDTFRVGQSLEWEPNWAVQQNSEVIDYSGDSGFIDMKFSSDMADSHLPPNPKKCILHRPSVPHLIAVIAAACETLSSDGVLLLYISASGGAGSQKHDLGLVLSSCGNTRYNYLYPSDLIPFTRSPLFLIIDSDISCAFKNLHGADRGEPPVLLLSPQKSTLEAGPTAHGSVFTLFLTSPLQAFCLLVGLSDIDPEVCGNAESILAAGMAKWEVIICSSAWLNPAYARVLPDPFLRRLITRFIFCRSALGQLRGDRDEEYLPEIWPELPASVSPESSAVESVLRQIAESIGVFRRFRFSDADDQ
ncbi:uncharacterized protein LOC144701801 isoform X2 [Wolffia australiana]